MGGDSMLKSLRIHSKWEADILIPIHQSMNNMNIAYTCILLEDETVTISVKGMWYPYVRMHCSFSDITVRIDGQYVFLVTILLYSML